MFMRVCGLLKVILTIRERVVLRIVAEKYRNMRKLDCFRDVQEPLLNRCRMAW